MGWVAGALLRQVDALHKLRILCIDHLAIKVGETGKEGERCELEVWGLVLVPFSGRSMLCISSELCVLAT